MIIQILKLDPQFQIYVSNLKTKGENHVSSFSKREIYRNTFSSNRWENLKKLQELGKHWVEIGKVCTSMLPMVKCESRGIGRELPRLVLVHSLNTSAPTQPPPRCLAGQRFLFLFSHHQFKARYKVLLCHAPLLLHPSMYNHTFMVFTYVHLHLYWHILCYISSHIMFKAKDYCKSLQ